MVNTLKVLGGEMILLINSNFDVNQAYHDGANLAFLASFKGESKCLQLLIDANCYLNEKYNYGATPAFIASRKGETKCLYLFL